MSRPHRNLDIHYGFSVFEKVTKFVWIQGLRFKPFFKVSIYNENMVDF